MIAFYMDVHIPLPVTAGLRRRGIDVVTAQDDARDEAEDEHLLSRAVDLGRVLVTMDQDFHRIAADWQRAGRTFPGILFTPQRGVSIGRLIDDLELIAGCSDSRELQDRLIRIPFI